MKLETSRDLLERLRAKHASSWWGLSKIIPASESTVNNWKHGRSAIGREYVTRIVAGNGFAACRAGCSA